MERSSTGQTWRYKTKPSNGKDYQVERFRFVLSINGSPICSRYFKINGFREESIYSEDLKEAIDSITTGLFDEYDVPLGGGKFLKVSGIDRGIINSDLTSKSRVYLWYSVNNFPIKSVGFENPAETEYVDVNANAPVDPDDITGKIINHWNVTFKFAFLVDGKEVISRIWDGYAYPKYVRDNVDITNKKHLWENLESESMTYSLYLTRKMTIDREDLCHDIIEKICHACSYGYGIYNRSTPIPKYRTKVSYTNEDGTRGKTYNLDFKRSYARDEDSIDPSYVKKTKKYLEGLFPTERECAKIDLM